MKIIKIITMLFILGILLLGSIYFAISFETRKELYGDIEKLPNKKVAIVLGTSKYRIGGGINKYYQTRIDAIGELFFKGKIEYVLISGDNALKEYNEPVRMQKSLLEIGIPKEKIYLDFAGFRTLDSIVRANKVFKLKECIVVSQKFQNERAIYIGKKLKMQMIGYNANDPKRLKVYIREIFARVKLILDVYILKTQPKFLGKKIEIG